MQNIVKSRALHFTGFNIGVALANGRKLLGRYRRDLRFGNGVIDDGVSQQHSLGEWQVVDFLQQMTHGELAIVFVRDSHRLPQRKAFVNEIMQPYKDMTRSGGTLEIGGSMAGGTDIQARVESLIDKARLLDRLRDKLNARQEKMLLRILAEGPEGFKGGLDAGNYVYVARTSPATATRDLADLVDKSALERTDERRHARYHLAIPLRPVNAVMIDDPGEVVTFHRAS